MMEKTQGEQGDKALPWIEGKYSSSSAPLFPYGDVIALYPS